MPLFVGFAEFIELLEAMTIDDFREFAIGIVANKTTMIKHHQLAILGGIGLPSGKPLDIWIAIVGKLGPGITHLIGKFQVSIARLGQVVLGAMEGIETELQLVSKRILSWRYSTEDMVLILLTTVRTTDCRRPCTPKLRN